MVRGLAAVVLTIALAAALAACGGLDRGDYVKANERLFEQLPAFPGARLESETSTAYRDESGPVLGYGTRFDFRLPRAATVTDVSSFFQRQLEPKWRLVEKLEGSVFNFRRGKSFVSINLENARIHVLEVAVDHADYGKLGR